MARPESKPKTPFGARLRQTRKGFGAYRKHDSKYSAKDFAEQELGIEAETYRAHERGETQPSLEVLARIRQVTGQSLDWLICGDKLDTPAPTPTTVKALPHLRRA